MKEREREKEGLGQKDRETANGKKVFEAKK